MKKYRSFFLLIILLFAVVACKNELTEINKNPNATEVPEPSYLLSSTQYASANFYWGSSANYNSTLLWIQHWAKIQYTEQDCYNVNHSSSTPIWDTGYATLLKNLDTILTSTKSNDNYKAVAQIWSAWVYLQLTNFFGNIPYSAYGKTITPAYDTQESILKSLLEKLETAGALLNPSNGNLEGDLIYHNNIDSWKKLAASLRLRIALEIADRDEDTAKRIIKALYSQRSSLISDNSENARFVFSASPQWNPWASTFSTRDDQRVSKTLIDVLKQKKDPRLALFAQLPQDASVTTYEGAANGLSADVANNQGFYKVSRPGTAFLKAEAPATFYTYAEVLFTFAEAAARGWINADAESLYQAAIKTSMEQFGITDVEVINTYLAQESVQYEAATWYKSIGWQKWIAYYGQGPDAFTDWRRLGYPQLIPGPNSVLNAGELPRRLFYPHTEQSLNGANYKANLTVQGQDELITRLWFDVVNKKR